MFITLVHYIHTLIHYIQTRAIHELILRASFGYYYSHLPFLPSLLSFSFPLLHFSLSLSEMQSRWRSLIPYFTCVLRGNLSRSSGCRKFTLVSLLCGLCLVYYCYHINTNIQRITNWNNNYLVATSSLQSFTEISRQYSNQDTSQSSLNVSTPSTSNGMEFSTVPPVPATSTVRADDNEETQSSHQILTDVGTKSSPDAVLKLNSAHNSKSGRKSRASPTKTPRVLVVYGTNGYKLSVEVKVFLEAYRVNFLHTSTSKGHSLLSYQKNSSRDDIILDHLSLIIIVATIAHYNSSYGRPYFNYCQLKGLPLIWLVMPTNTNKLEPLPTIANVDVFSLESEAIIHMSLSSNYPFFYARPGASTVSVPHNKQWTAFIVKSGDSHVTSRNLNSSSVPHKETPPSAGSNYRSLVEVATVSDRHSEKVKHILASSVIEDIGKFDGVRKIIMGLPIRSWLTHLILLDAVRVLCEGVGLVRGGRERSVMVDIDDIFVAPEGRKMTTDDVKVTDWGDGGWGGGGASSIVEANVHLGF